MLYLGLAIAGEGCAVRFFSHPPPVGVTVMTITLGGAALFNECHVGPRVREVHSNRWVIGALGALGFAIAYLLAFFERLDLFTFGGEGGRWLGFALFSLCGLLRLVPVFVLGRRFRVLVAIQPDHELETGGILCNYPPSELPRPLRSGGVSRSARSLAPPSPQ
jgi:protein-S-isoprenylcysteine O-methyltransferase Ste14